MALGNPVYRNSGGARQASDTNFNLETNTGTGWYDARAVGGLIYDIFDAPVPDDDPLSLGFAAIHAEMTGAVKTTPAFVTVFPLLHTLLADHAANAADLRALTLARGMGDVAGNVADDFGTGEIHDGGDAQNLPLYRALTSGAPATNVCTNDASGTYDALGNRRWFRYAVAAGGNIGLALTGAGSPAALNPDVVIYRLGLEVGRGGGSGNESLTLSSMPASTYLLDVYEAGNVQPGAPGVGSACIDVSIN